MAAIPHVVDEISAFLVPLSAPAVPGLLARGRLLLVRFIIGALACNPAVHYLERRQRARQALTGAAFAGDVAFMEEIYNLFGCLIDETMVREAVRGGRIDALRWLHAKLVAPGSASDRQAGEEEHVYTPAYTDMQLLEFFSSDLLAVVAKNDDLEMLQMLLELMRQHSTVRDARADLRVALRAARVAARYGRHRILNWLRPSFELPPAWEMDNEEHTGPYDDSLPRYECRWCRHEVVQKGCTMWRMNHAASLGRLEDVKWFHVNRSLHGCSSSAMNFAATNGHLDVVRWLHANRQEGCNGFAMQAAARNGHFKVVRSWSRIDRKLWQATVCKLLQALDGFAHSCIWCQGQQSGGGGGPHWRRRRRRPPVHHQVAAVCCERGGEGVARGPSRGQYDSS